MEITKQQEFWDEESSIDDYFRNYLDCVTKNSWTAMFENVEHKSGFRVFGNVLEIGGGSQYLSRFLSVRKDINIVCTDISDQRIKLSNQYYKTLPANIKTMGNINAQCLPFKDEQFDFIIGDAVLHHIEDLRSGLYEINRCLKPNGKAIFIREPVLGIDILFKRRLKKFINRKKYTLEKLKFIIDNKFEFDKFLFQWSEEFYRAGFDFKSYKGWYYKNNKDVLKSRFPILFTSLISFHLTKSVDIKELSVH
ncbi:MAG: class I SAM-dependent methyltransferase [Bacteroidota bacterium]